MTGTCAAGSAIGTVNKAATVACNTALPTQVGTTDSTATVGSTATTVSSAALPAGASYLAWRTRRRPSPAEHNVRHVTVSCTLTVGSNTQMRTVTIDTDGTDGDKSARRSRSRPPDRRERPR